MANQISNKVFSGFFWKFSERILAQLISFIVSIVLARILSPDDYGLVAMGMVFINIANVFVANGFSAALVQKQDVDEKDFSTIFFISLAISIVLYVLLFFCTPYIAKFYNSPLLCDVLRVYGFILPLSAYKSIQNAYVTKTLDFRKFFFSTLTGTIVSAVVGIIMAIKGFGVWALVAQYFTNNIIDSVVLTFTIKWKPKLVFSRKNALPLLSYGSKILGADLLGTIYNQLNAFLIGKKYTPSDLAYYTRGKQFPDLISININVSLTSVLFPAFSIVSDDYENVKKMGSRAIKVSAFVLLPFYFGLISVSSNLVKILLTDKWLFCVPFLMIMCVNGIIGVLDTIDIQLLKAIGKSGTVFKIEFIKKPLYLIITLLALKFNLYILAATVPISSVIAVLINSYCVNKYIGYSLWSKIKEVIKSFMSALLMGSSVYLLNYLSINIYVIFTLQIIAGVGLYILLSVLLKNDSMKYLLSILKRSKTDENTN